MFKKLTAITVIAILVFTNQNVSAQSVETLDAVIACVHKTPFSKGEPAVYECYDKMFEECFLVDPPGEFGQGKNTSEACYLSVVDQVKLKMTKNLENKWPDKNTSGYQLRDIAIEYAAKRTELNCDFLRALDTVGKRETDDENYDIKRRENQLAQCLFGSTIVNYWKIVVHNKLF